jgi:hypothetical protein
MGEDARVDPPPPPFARLLRPVAPPPNQVLPPRQHGASQHCALLLHRRTVVNPQRNCGGCYSTTHSWSLARAGGHALMRDTRESRRTLTHARVRIERKRNRLKSATRDSESDQSADSGAAPWVHTGSEATTQRDAGPTTGMRRAAATFVDPVTIESEANRKGAERLSEHSQPESDAEWEPTRPNR